MLLGAILVGLAVMAWTCWQWHTERPEDLTQLELCRRIRRRMDAQGG
jgi:hypothetical protein